MSGSEREDEIVPVDEASRAFGMSPDTLARAVERPQIAVTIRDSDGAAVVRVGDVTEWIERGSPFKPGDLGWRP